MVKFIATDMDGTLLDPHQKVSKENIEAIERARREGVEVIVATGRSYQEARFALDEANIECPVICVNGAAVFSSKGEVIASNPIQVNTVKAAAEYLEQNGIYFEIYTNKGTYSKDYDRATATIVDIILTANPDLDPLKVTEMARKRVEIGQVKSIPSYDLLFEDPSVEYYKLLVFSPDFQALEEASRVLKQNENLAVTSSGRENLEINSKDAQKGIALEKYIKARGGSMEEVMAIGDNYNDVSMLQRVGRSVAMGNAPLDIQQQCDFVTDTNEENGVANAILLALAEQTANK
ncbi:Cof-type HAD-IIB family hydrolase [Peribacillus sp. SCS-155]|uniref:Cof-type HAD-IIB family hydrolase n=1 Tax=Peribacillus sedimenti TaxID=3115297 RepID=UPI003906C0CC